MSAFPTKSTAKTFNLEDIMAVNMLRRSVTVSSPKSVPSTSSNSMLPSFWRITYAHTSRVTAFMEAPVLKTSSMTEDVLFSSKIWPTRFKKVDFPTRAFPTAAITRIGRSICDISFKASGFNSNLNAFDELLSFTERSRILACCASVTIGVTAHYKSTGSNMPACQHRTYLHRRVLLHGRRLSPQEPHALTCVSDSEESDEDRVLRKYFKIVGV